MTAADRISLIIGRAILRAESMAADLESAQQRIRQLETELAAAAAQAHDQADPDATDR